MTWLCVVHSALSAGDLGESKDCTESKQLFAGTTECFKMVKEFLDGWRFTFVILHR